MLAQLFKLIDLMPSLAFPLLRSWVINEDLRAVPN